jgi:hypothetical protein
MLLPHALRRQTHFDPRSKGVRRTLFQTPNAHQSPNRLFELIQVQATPTVVQMLADLNNVIVRKLAIDVRRESHQTILTVDHRACPPIFASAPLLPEPCLGPESR